MTKFFQKTKEVVLDILFPPLCLSCKKYLPKTALQEMLCETCFNAIPLNTTFICPVCSARFSENKKICHLDTPFRLLAAGFYSSEILKNLIWMLKYEGKSVAAKPLASLIEKHLSLTELTFQEYLLIPMPLHSSRRRERGFNQTELIAQHIASKYRFTLRTDILQKIRFTKPQMEIKDFEKRKENMKNTFSILHEKDVAGKNILLLDDVFTSGATMYEAVRTLKSAHAHTVIGLVAAKAGQ